MAKKCFVKDCQNVSSARGLCQSHYASMRRDGTLPLIRVHNRGCLVEGCNSPHDAHGYCSVHRQRKMRHGDPLAKLAASPGEPDQFLAKALKYQGDECLIWPCYRDNQGRAKIARKGKSPQYVGRIICREVHGKPPSSKHEAAHSCGNGHLGCIAPRHLYWATHQQNAFDMILHARSTRGERSASAKLTKDEVLEIRSLGGKHLQREIAEMYGVDPETIGDILHGRTWSWLK
jgi:hypothetical protein